MREQSLGFAVQKERPILFTSEMVQAILAGRKTQTRRLITAANSLLDGYQLGQKKWDAYELDFNDAFVDKGPSTAGNSGPYLKVKSRAHDTRHRIYSRKQPGDVLWLRETWAAEPRAPEYSEDVYLYRASLPDGVFNGRWKPSIFMPRAGCRLFLEVTDVRVERLQDITEKDAEAEGAPAVECGPVYCCKCGFANLWKKINGPESWNAKPWVWVISFKQISQP